MQPSTLNSDPYPIYVDFNSPEYADKAHQEAMAIVQALGGEGITGAMAPEAQKPTNPEVALPPDIDISLASELLTPELTPAEIAQAEREARQEMQEVYLDTEPKLYLHLAERLLPRPEGDIEGNPLDLVTSWHEGAPATHMIFELVRAYAAIGETDKANEVLNYFSTSEVYTARSGLKRVEEIAAAQIAVDAGGFESQASKVQELRQQLIEDVRNDKVTLGLPVPSRQSDQQIHQAVEGQVASVMDRWEQAKEEALNPERQQEYEQQAQKLESLRQELMAQAKQHNMNIWLTKPSRNPRLIDANKLRQVEHVSAMRAQVRERSQSDPSNRDYQYWTGVLQNMLLPNAQLTPSSAPRHLFDLFTQGGPKEVAAAIATATKVDKKNISKECSTDTMIAVCEFAIGRQRQIWHEMA